MNESEIALVAYNLGLGMRTDGFVLASFGFSKEEAERVLEMVKDELEKRKVKNYEH